MLLTIETMGTKPRSPGQTNTSISIEQKLLDAVDARAGRLGITRSQYFVQLAEADLADRGPFVIHEKPGTPPAAAPRPEPNVDYIHRRKKP